VLLQGGVTKGKLPDEGTPQHSCGTLQQCYHLLQHLVERHTDGHPVTVALPSRPMEAA
jgi:hypothetical protein